MEFAATNHTERPPAIPGSAARRHGREQKRKSVPSRFWFHADFRYYPAPQAIRPVISYKARGSGSWNRYICMHRSARLLIFLTVLTAAAQDTPKPQFTPRELFYSAASEPAPAAKQAPKPAAPAPRKAVSARKPAVAPPVQTTAVETARPAAPTVAVETPRPPASQATTPVSAPDSGMVINASLVTAPAPATGTPLGLKYAILKKVGSDMVEVPPDTVFHPGDRIQLSVQTNGPGYLYIISKGSSGTWKPMFPSPEVADGNNHVDGWNPSVVPPGHYMLFNEQTGTEHIFIVFSRTPEEGLEDMIYSLKDGNAKPAAEKSQPVAEPKKLLLSAMADIPDSTVGKLKDTYTRDLVIEKVDDKTPGDKSPEKKKENAVYVVNPSGSPDSRVVAEVPLVNQ